MNRRNFLGTLFIFSVLIISQLRTVSAGPIYVGVTVGDEYSWSAQNHRAGYIEFFKIRGVSSSEAESAVNEMDQAGAFDLVTISLKVDAIGNDTEGYSIINVTMAAKVNSTGENSPFWSIFLKGQITVQSEYSSFNGDLWWIVAIDIDWERVISDRASSAPPGATITQNGNGYTASASQGGNSISISLTYDDKGVLLYYEEVYNGHVAVSIGTRAIPGFELPFLLGVTGAFAIGLIYIVLKKREKII